MPRTAQTLIVDSGFWIALLDPRDQYHAEAGSKAAYLELGRDLCPWPTLYETVCTRLVKNRMAMRQYECYLEQPGVHFVDDAPYRDDALRQVLNLARVGRRHIALTDMVIRQIIEDVNVRSDYLLTFNPPDFADVCASRHVEML